MNLLLGWALFENGNFTHNEMHVCGITGKILRILAEQYRSMCALLSDKTSEVFHNESVFCIL
jgi:hypothetical protein